MGISPFNHKLKFFEQCNHVTIQTYCIYTLRYIRIRSIQLTHNIICSFQQAKQSVENDTVSDYVQESMWQLLTIFERLNKPEKCVLIVFEPGNKLVTCNVQNLSNTQIYSACTHCDKQRILVLSFVSIYSYTKINRKKSFGHKIHNPAYIDLQQNGNVIKKAWNCHLTHWHWEDNWLFIAERRHSMQEVNNTVDNGNSLFHCFGWHQIARSALDQMAPATWSGSQPKISQEVKAAQRKNFIFVKQIVNSFKYN